MPKDIYTETQPLQVTGVWVRAIACEQGNVLRELK